MKCRKCARYSKRLSQKSPICNACGYFGVLAVDFDLSQARVAAAKPKRRNCRDCGQILTKDRYFHCHGCRQPAERPSEDVWFDGFAAFERVSHLQPLAIQGLKYGR